MLLLGSCATRPPPLSCNPPAPPSPLLSLHADKRLPPPTRPAAWEEGSKIKLFLCTFPKFSLDAFTAEEGSDPVLSLLTIDLESGATSREHAPRRCAKSSSCARDAQGDHGVHGRAAQLRRPSSKRLPGPPLCLCSAKDGRGRCGCGRLPGGAPQPGR